MPVQAASLANLIPIRPGETRNPGGKPVNARNRLTKAFLEDLADDFEANGKAAIKAAREGDPTGYVRAIASLMPKELIVERPTDGLTDEQLALALEFIRNRIAEIEREQADGGSDLATISQPAEVLPPV